MGTQWAAIRPFDKNHLARMIATPFRDLDRTSLRTERRVPYLAITEIFINQLSDIHRNPRVRIGIMW